MADLTITAANVVRGGDANVEYGVAGATITAGQVVYKEAATGQFKLADNNAVGEVRVPYGIALHAASTGQPLAVQTSGDITIGGTMVAGTAYYLGDVAGAICPPADLTTGEQVSLLGIAKSTTVLMLRLLPSGVTL